MIWDRIDRLIDRSPSLRDLQAHGLHLLAARRWRSLGRPIPADLARAELWAALRVNAAGDLMARIRAACEGPIVLIKGPSVASLYPEPTLRPFIDLDLLVSDPEDAQRALLAAGFEPVPARSHPDLAHHLHPLQFADRPLSVEVHRYPKWLPGLEPPSLGELLEDAEPAALGVDDVMTPAPAKHALILASHLWSHDPLARLLRLVDVAVMTAAADASELERIAKTWEMERVWRATTRVTGTLLGDRRPMPLPLRTWARNLSTAREPTVLEMHVARCVAPFWVLPPRRALAALGAAVAGLIRPQPYESWGGKVRRTVAQLRQPSMRRSDHARDVNALRAGKQLEDTPPPP
jgi:hypothetical protein